MAERNKMKKDVRRWLGYRFSSGVETGDDYLLFQREMKADLKKKAQKAGCNLYKFFGNHYEFSAILQDVASEHFVYIAISDVRFWQDKWYTGVLYRTMKNDHDWKGGSNSYCTWSALPESVRSLLDREVF